MSKGKLLEKCGMFYIWRGGTKEDVLLKYERSQALPAHPSRQSSMKNEINGWTHGPRNYMKIQLMRCRKHVASPHKDQLVNAESYKTHKNTLINKRSFINIKASGAHSYHRALKV